MSDNINIDKHFYVYYSRHMDILNSTEIFGALSQHTRLSVFRFLVTQEPHGCAAGEIAKQFNIPHNTMSSHLAILERNALVSSSRAGRSIVYRVKIETIRELLVYMLKDCCGGHRDLCLPLIGELQSCCRP